MRGSLATTGRHAGIPASQNPIGRAGQNRGGIGLTLYLIHFLVTCDHFVTSSQGRRHARCGDGLRVNFKEALLAPKQTAEMLKREIVNYDAEFRKQHAIGIDGSRARH